MASGKSSRRKGVTGENESANMFRRAGFEVVRLQNNVLDAGDYIANALLVADGELVNLSLIVDSKRRERLHLGAASQQVEAVACDGQVPCVVYRRSREPWRVSLRLEDFLRIVSR